MSAKIISKLSNTTLPASEKSAQGNGRKILLILAVIFALPFTIAATLHLLNIKASSHSYGDLVKPVIGLKFPILHDIQGKAFNAQQWQKKWSIVTIDSNGCAAPCQAQVHILKQVHISLDKDYKRVQQVLLVPAKADLSALQKQYPELVILSGTDNDTVKFADAFNVPVSGANVQSAGRIYLIDPLGNLMMTYPENMNPKGLRSDLMRLLKNSWAG